MDSWTFSNGGKTVASFFSQNRTTTYPLPIWLECKQRKLCHCVALLCSRPSHCCCCSESLHSDFPDIFIRPTRAPLWKVNVRKLGNSCLCHSKRNDGDDSEVDTIHGILFLLRNKCNPLHSHFTFPRLFFFAFNFRNAARISETERKCKKLKLNE